jgi:hypothetical protein
MRVLVTLQDGSAMVADHEAVREAFERWPAISGPWHFTTTNGAHLDVLSLNPQGVAIITAVPS